MRKLALLIIGMLLAIVIAGCGGGGGESEEVEEVAGRCTGDAVAGETLYSGTCIACHGPDAKGLPNLGKDLTVSEFFKSKSDAELLTFVKTGRPVGDPDNTTGVDMPPRGGNPALSDEDITHIIAYICTLEE
jgi:mono/diheme cytochrome c family protein